jgi:hypothetical protein
MLSVFNLLFDNLGSLAIGAGGLGAGVVGVKGIPASWAWLKARLAAGKVDLASLKGEVADAQTAVAALEGKVSPAIAQLQADVKALQAKVPA